MEEFKEWYKEYSKQIEEILKQTITTRDSKIANLEEKSSLTTDSITGKKIARAIRQEKNLLNKAKMELEMFSKKTAEEQLEALGKNSRLSNVYVDKETGKSLNLITKALRNGRNGLGRFRIVLRNDSYATHWSRVMNIDYQDKEGDLDHWAVRNGLCCWGDWGDQISYLLKKGNLFEILQFMIVYLETSPDTNTYCDREDYIMRRDKLSKEESSKLESLSYKNIDRYYNGDPIEGLSSESVTDMINTILEL